MDAASNKERVRRLFEESDRNWGSVDFLDEWFTDDCKIHFGGSNMDLEAYKQLLPVLHSAFSDVRHEIHLMLAEDDLVSAAITIHTKHTGEWEGIAATGRTVSFADLVVLRLRDGKVVEEWAVVDMAHLRQQLEADS